MDLNSKIENIKERLTRCERNKDGKIVVGRMYDELIVEIEELFDQNIIRRPVLSEKLGLTLLQLTTLEEEIFQHRTEQELEALKPKPQVEVLESIQFQEVKLPTGETLPVPKEPNFADTRTWIRIVSMTGLKVEVNSLSAALEVLKTVLEAHRRPGAGP